MRRTVSVLAVALVAGACSAQYSALDPSPIMTVQAVERDFTSNVVLDATIVRAPVVTIPRIASASEIVWSAALGPVTAGQEVAVELGTYGGVPLSHLERELAEAERDLEYTRQMTALDLEGARGQDRTTRQRAELQAARTIEVAEARVAEARTRHDAAGALTRTVTAPISGNLVIDVGENTLGHVEPEVTLAMTELQPLLRLRLPDSLEAADFTIPGVSGVGRPCSTVEIQEPEATVSAWGTSEMAPTLILCTIPGDVRVYPGLTAVIVVQIARIEKALALPLDAVRLIEPGLGEITVVGPGGVQQPRRVPLGPTDGLVVVVSSDLQVGEVVLIRPAETPNEGSG